MRPGRVLWALLLSCACASNTSPPSVDGGSLPPVHDAGGTGSAAAEPAFLELAFDADGGSLPVAPPAAGWLPEETSGQFVDLDDDGTDEVLLSSAEATRAYGLAPDGRSLVLRPDLAPPHDGQVVGALDLDDDGAADLLTFGPAFHLRFRTPDGYTAPVELGSGVLDFPTLPGLSVADVDADGWLDLLLPDNRCDGTAPATLLLRTGPRAFTDATALLTGTLPVAPYAVTAFPLFDGSLRLAFLGRACTGNGPAPLLFGAADRTEQGFPRFAPVDPLPPPGVANLARGSPMAVALADLTGSGETDLLFTLADQIPLFHLGRDGSVRDATISANLLDAHLPDHDTPWALALVDLNRDGRPDVLATHGRDFSVGPATHAESVEIHVNDGGLRFHPVPDAGLSRPGHWRGLSVGDLDGDGAPDLLVGGVGEAPRVYRNDLRGPGALALAFHGTTSNALGLGARVDVSVAGLPDQHLLVTDRSGPVMLSQPLVFAGLGPSRSAALVRVTWPSGTVQELRDVAGGAVVRIEEPRVFSVLPASRHVPAGSGSATIVVTPRRADGSPDPDASVDVSLLAGTGSVNAAVNESGTWTATLSAPPEAGSAVVGIRINGTLLGVRPRIWFDR